MHSVETEDFYNHSSRFSDSPVTVTQNAAEPQVLSKRPGTSPSQQFYKFVNVRIKI